MQVRILLIPRGIRLTCSAEMDILHEKTKEDYHGSATQHLNHCAEDSEYLSGQTCMLTRGAASSIPFPAFPHRMS